jgi:hypothetical protein
MSVWIVIAESHMTSTSGRADIIFCQMGKALAALDDAIAFHADRARQGANIWAMEDFQGSLDDKTLGQRPEIGAVMNLKLALRDEAIW